MNIEENFEKSLPEYLQKSIEQMKTAWEKKEKENYLGWDCEYCELQSDINVAENEGNITTEQAWCLREKYLHIERTGVR